MGRTGNTFVLRLLWEARAGSHRRLIRVERGMEEVPVDAGQAMGAAGLAFMPAGNDGNAAPKRRVQELEARK